MEGQIGKCDPLSKIMIQAKARSLRMRGTYPEETKTFATRVVESWNPTYIKTDVCKGCGTN